MTRELDHLRRQTVDLQMETERTSAQLAKVANECDVARATTQRLTGQLEDVERRKRELEVELARARGSRDVDVYERRRIEAETSRDQEKFSEILKEVETLQVCHLFLGSGASLHACLGSVVARIVYSHAKRLCLDIHTGMP